MVILWFYFALIVRAENKSMALIRGSPLVGTVEDALDTCTDISKLVDDFREVYHNLDDRRRVSSKADDLDDEKLVDGVEDKLGVCTGIVKAVHNFQKEINAIDAIGKDEVQVNVEAAPVVLNVGGTYFATNRATLLSVKGSIFEKMISKELNFTVGPDGAYFLDRDPDTFRYIMDYFRNGDLFIKSGDYYLRRQVLADAEYYELPKEVKEYLKWMANRQIGIDLMLSEVTFLNKQLKPISKKLGALLYRASVDGDSYSAFHSLCDNKGPTVVIVEDVHGNIFGGYTYTSWSGPTTGAYVGSSGSFLFRLRPSMKRYGIKSGREGYAIYRKNTYGPTFGGGHEIYIASGCRSSTSSYTNCGNTYDAPSYELTNGVRNFRVHDYVVVHANSL